MCNALGHAPTKDKQHNSTMPEKTDVSTTKVTVEFGQAHETVKLVSTEAKRAKALSLEPSLLAYIKYSVYNVKCKK